MKNKMLLSILVIALAAALVGGATMAWFTDAATTGEVNFQAGTLMIDVDNPQQVGTEVNLERLNPGDCAEWEFDVTNQGTKSANWLLYMCWKDTVGLENDGLGEGQQDLLAAREGFGTNPLSEKLLWTITIDGDVAYNGVGLSGAPAVFDELVAFSTPGEGVATTKHVTVQACLPETAGNEYQGGKMDIFFGVKAWQTTNNAPAPEVTEEDCPWNQEQQNLSDYDVSNWKVSYVCNGAKITAKIEALDQHGNTYTDLNGPVTVVHGIKYKAYSNSTPVSTSKNVNVTFVNGKADFTVTWTGTIYSITDKWVVINGETYK